MTTGEWRALDSIADLPESPDDVESQGRKTRGRFGEDGMVGDNAAIAKDAYGANWWQQYLILSSRSFKSRRFEALSPQDISLIMVIGTLTGGLLSSPPVNLCLAQLQSCFNKHIHKTIS
jgi:hypothetical protein